MNLTQFKQKTSKFRRFAAVFTMIYTYMGKRKIRSTQLVCGGFANTYENDSNKHLMQKILRKKANFSCLD